MELSHEDQLRLNVLLKQKPKAIRIDEAKMILYALTERGEAQVQLSPTCRETRYLRWVREMLSSHALGSPGGYPVFLERWTRMGQARGSQSIQGLLLLGEPEAVVAVAHDPGLTEEYARHAWWALPNAEVARRMLANEAVANSGIGAELAAFLLEFLPFETDSQATIDTVRLLLLRNLLTQEQRDGLWRKGQRKSAYLIGFMQALPDDLPNNPLTTPPSIEPVCHRLAAEGNAYAKFLLRLCSGAGQAYLATLNAVMDKISDQEATIGLIHTLEDYVARLPRPPVDSPRRLNEIPAAVAVWLAMESDQPLRELLQACPTHVPQIEAMLGLALVGMPALDQIFGQTDSVGSVMRRKLEPVFDPVRRCIAVLN